MRLLYTKPRLNDLSQGSRIAFARQFRTMSQDEVSDILGLTGECKRKTMTRYEKGDRNPKLKRLEEISSILKVNINSLKEYDFIIIVNQYKYFISYKMDRFLSLLNLYGFSTN